MTLIAAINDDIECDLIRSAVTWVLHISEYPQSLLDLLLVDESLHNVGVGNSIHWDLVFLNDIQNLLQLVILDESINETPIDLDSQILLIDRLIDLLHFL